MQLEGDSTEASDVGGLVLHGRCLCLLLVSVRLHLNSVCSWRSAHLQLRVL